MSRQANPRVVGGFVLGAILLAVVAVVAFGSLELRPDKVKFVVYFDGAITGLSVGSPVLFRGAQVGEVTDIVVRVGPTDVEPKIPVYMEIDRNNFQVVGREKAQAGSGVPGLIERGLRAKLITQSMITGQLAVLLDFLPAVPAEFEGDEAGVIELPSAPSLQEQLTTLFEKLQDLPVGGLVSDIRHAIQGVDELVRSEEVAQAIRSVQGTLDEFKNLAGSVREQIDPIAGNLNGTLSEAREALKVARESIASVKENLNTAIENADKAIKNIDGKINPINDTLQLALKQADSTLATAEKLISQDSPTLYRLNDALAELSATLRSLRELADYLQRHPDSVFKGKAPPGGLQ